MSTTPNFLPSSSSPPPTTRRGHFLTCTCTCAGLPPNTNALSLRGLESELSLRDLDTDLAVRAVSNAPDGYTPRPVKCPSTRPSIRNGTSISPQEREWLPLRRNETIPAIRDLLSRIAIPNFNAEQYLRNVENDPTALPNIGLAVSGGGYRAMLNGAGAVAAWDSRSDGSTTAGNLGGLLQSATYISGLSGGGWLLGSLYVNNFTSVQDSVHSGDIWQTQDSILGGEQTDASSYHTANWLTNCRS